MVLRREFVPRKDDIGGDWRKLHDEEHCNLYCSSDIIRMMKSRMR
jgi:hypothetical protein